MAAIDRRTFVCRSAVLGRGLAASGPLAALSARTAHGQSPPRSPGYGPLVAKGDLALPVDFNYRVISRQGVPMSDGQPTPGIFDGMGSYPGPGNTTILIRNHENRRRPGEIPVVVPADKRYDPDPTYDAGDTKLVVRRRRTGRRDRASGQPLYFYEVIRDFAILGGTDTNCAGGVVGNSWITSEEVVNRGASGKKHGYNFEIPAYANGPAEARPIVSMGRFVHEAVAELYGVIYETEDRSISADPLTRKRLLGSCFYRYRPYHRNDDHDDDDGDDDDDGRWRSRGRGFAERGGRLQALKLKGEAHANMDVGRVVGRSYPVEWVDIDDVDPEDDTDNRRDRVRGFTPVRVQAQDREAAFFDREEGIWTDYRRGVVYFDCTTGGAQNLGQVWEFDPRRQAIKLIYESTEPARLENPDNVVVVPRTGEIFLQEDGEDGQYVRGVTPRGEIYDFAQSITNDTEFCGGCFDPDGKTLYLNQQGERGGLPDGPPDGRAVTYAIYGPFEKRRRRDDDDEDD